MTENITVKEFVSELVLGNKKEYRNMAVVPLFFNGEEKTRYITLKSALSSGYVEIFEKSLDGSVSELRVINRSDRRVLIADSEELSGAKQNRILNTTILLEENSETIIPVSCTESGRWNYTSRNFRDSGNMAIPKMRGKKVASVSRSLQAQRAFHSDQLEVWEMVDEMLRNSGTNSPTRSMKEVFERKRSYITGYLNAFRIENHQKGFIVVINGKVAGMDYFSSDIAFRVLYPKILKSYAMEADLQPVKTTSGVSYKKPGEMINRILSSEIFVYKSPGIGYDHRITGKELDGNSLVYDNEVIHLAAFNNDDDGKRYRRRRFR